MNYNGLFNTLHKLPKSCIFGLYNPKKGKVYLSFCKSLLTRLHTLIPQLEEGTHKCRELCEDIDDLELIVFEETGYSTIRELMEYWYDYTEEQGLSLYERRVYVKYTPRITVGTNYKGEDVLIVLLVNGRNDKTVVGLFDNKYEADDFVNVHFRNTKYIRPVYANNEMTKEYIERENSNLDKIFRMRF